MKCDKIEPLVSAYAFGECPEEEVQRIEEHLEHCEPCRIRLNAYHSLATGIRQIPSLTIPTNQNDKLSLEMRRVRHRSTSRDHHPAKRRFVLIPAFALMFFLLMTSVLIVKQVIRTTPELVITDQMSLQDIHSLSEQLTDVHFLHETLDTPIALSDLISMLQTLKKQKRMDSRINRKFSEILENLTETRYTDDLPVPIQKPGCGLSEFNLARSIHCLKRIRLNQDQITLREIHAFLAQHQSS